MSLAAVKNYGAVAMLAVFVDTAVTAAVRAALKIKRQSRCCPPSPLDADMPELLPHQTQPHNVVRLEPLTPQLRAKRLE